ncbi:unnamed protein product [Peronospora belbahrii]|uniref:Amino acid transporter transmembrane domain-containing protein n=1 Tax=Peronospora belbahrii TaxID=622444 RepID=A0AAU9KWY7_9STRA|nr:unnamed protein product [Peronospora belbahrii]CAH0516298.1 unnamed protein product [Peronospora belbahrii]
MTAEVNVALTLQVPDLEAIDLNSLSETSSTISSLSVHHVGDNDHDVNSFKSKQLTSSALNKPTETALYLTSDGKTFINTCIAFLGSGVLGLPYAFRQCGILMGLITLLGVAACSTYAMILVVQCKYKLKQQGERITNYGEIGYFAMGYAGSFIVNMALVISQTGFCIAYLIFIASNANKFLDVSKQLVVSVCVPPLVGLSLLKHMRELAYVAVIADLMCILGLLVVLNIDLTYMEQDHDDIKVIGVVSAVPFFFGVASYCFEVVIITSLYATFGICGYLAFGNDTDAVITLNFDGGGGLAILVQVFLCFGLFFTYPVMLFPVFEVLHPMMACGKNLESPQPSQMKGTVLRVSIVFFTAVVAAGIPDFGRFISFIGSTCCSLLAFIMPAFFHLCLFCDEPPTWKSRLHHFLLCAMMILGFAMLGVGVVEVFNSVH